MRDGDFAIFEGDVYRMDDLGRRRLVYWCSLPEWDGHQLTEMIVDNPESIHYDSDCMRLVQRGPI